MTLCAASCFKYAATLNVLTKLWAHWEDETVFYPITVNATHHCFLIGRDSCKSYLQSAGSQPGEWANDGGLWETGQWCECKTFQHVYSILDPWTSITIRYIHLPDRTDTLLSLRKCQSLVLSFSWTTAWLFFVFSSSSSLPPAAGVDPSHHPLAGEPNPREDCKWYAGETRGLQRLPLCPQTTQGFE